MADQTVRCVNCGRSFTWSEREQRRFQARGYAPPKRCPDCRAERRLTRAYGNPRDPRPWYRDPYVIFGELAYLAIVIGTTFQLVRLEWNWVLALLVAVNVVVFLMYGYDKLASKIFPVSMRIPEDILILSSLLFAFFGAQLGRWVFRHKTIDKRFRAKYYGLFIAEYFLLVLVAFVGFPTLLGWLGVK